MQQLPQRGTRVYNQLLFEDELAFVPAAKKYSYRNPELIAARDKFLIHRFYFKTKILQKNYPDSIKELVDEVWLSKIMIQKIITSKADDILLLKRQQITVKQLKSEWPHIVWD